MKLPDVWRSVTIYRWVHRDNSAGEAGLKRQPGQGRKKILTANQVETIKQWVQNEAGVWTLKRIRMKALKSVNK